MEDFFSHISEIEKKLDYRFKNKELLQLSFIHRSYLNEQKQTNLGCNERLEFLGDSVLELLIAEYLFVHCPSFDEGVLSQLRSQLVDAPICAEYVQMLNVESYLMLGKGEEQNRGRGRETILADLFESIIGAIFLDSDFDTVKRFFLSRFEPKIKAQIEQPAHNWKAELQDIAQKRFQQVPVYEVVEIKGPDHAREFRVAVYLQNQKRGEGVGLSKKEAQMRAAKEALKDL